MLLRIFQSNRLYVLILIPLAGLILWYKSLFSLYISEFSFDSCQMPLYYLIANILKGKILISVSISFVLLVIHAFLLIRLNTKFIFIKKRTYLPALFFILISGSFLPLQRLTPVIFASLLLLFAIEKIFNSYKKAGLSYNYFDAAFLISLGTLFYFNMIFYLLIIWIGLIIFRPFNWREWIISFLGFICPYIFVISYYYLFEGTLKNFLTTLINNFSPVNYLSSLSLSYYLFYSFLLFLILISSYYMIKIFPKKKINTRKYFIFFLWLFLITLIVYFVLPSTSIELLVILSIPVSYIISHYFDSIKSTWWSEALFILFVGFLCFIQIYN